MSLNNNRDNKNYDRKIILVHIILLLLLLYSLIQFVGYIEHRGLAYPTWNAEQDGPVVPTGNVDIFEINCNCNSNKENARDDINKNKPEIVVFDNYKIWDNKELRIFSNPAYNYKSIIAPGSSNSYTYVIRNNSTIDMVIDIYIQEENNKGINMQYKMRSKGKYVVGEENQYVKINNTKIEHVKLPAKSQISYIIDWKWIDNYNDTEIGFDINSNYKLSINIGANEDL